MDIFELHRPIRAIPALDAAMSRYNDSHARDKALYLSSLADSYLDASEIEHAAVTLGRSFDLAEHVASSRPGQHPEPYPPPFCGRSGRGSSTERRYSQWTTPQGCNGGFE